jgi:hypothetical protein
MPVLDSRRVKHCLNSKLGCISRNTDHEVFELYFNGTKIAWTKMSHGGGQLSDLIVGRMARQLQVSKTTFVSAVACNVTKEEFIAEALKTSPVATRPAR